MDWRPTKYARYFVNENGEVLGARGRKLAPARGAKGYLQVQIHLAGRSGFTCDIHRLICETFHGPAPSRLHHAAHVNGDRLDNRSQNLSWKTPKENEADKVLHGTKVRTNVKLELDDIARIKELYATGRWTQVQLARRFRVHQAQISRAIWR